MTIRERIEEMEKNNLSPYAALSCNSKGRDKEETECDLRPVYQRDRDRILHCKAFRRLKSKTQVFLDPQGDHYRTRMTHTLEVSQNARTLAKALRLNEDLTEAIALGHDLGHTPFGHAGERTLNALCEGGFRHYEQSVRVVERLEKNGEGLNLTWETRDGIYNHQVHLRAATLEGNIVRLSDKIAYIHHDVDDAIRGRIISEDQIPHSVHEILGYTTNDRLDTVINDIITNSMDKNEIIMSPEIDASMQELREFMFEQVYMNPVAKAEEVKAKRLLEFLFEHYMTNFHELPEKYKRMHEEGEDPMDRVVCDYISGMTDVFAYNLFEDYFMPKSWHIF